MQIAQIDLSKEVLVIAEIGNNHEGSFETAVRLVQAAAESGVQVVKFQTFRTELYINPAQTERFARIKSFELSFSEFEKLKRVCDDCGVIFLSTPFDLESAKFLSELAPAFKIGSGENNFYPLLEVVAKTGKPVILSSGLTDLEQIKHSKKFLESVWDRQNLAHNLAVLHCVTNYPVAPENAHLAAIPLLRSELQCTIGLSDHTIGLEAPLMAVALGARIIEKHFTLDKNFSEFRDHKISVDPAELKELVSKVRVAQQLLGNAEKRVLATESDIMGAVRRSIVVKSALPAGHKLAFEDLAWTRPSGGFAPGEEAKVIGRKLAKGLAAGEIVSPDALAD